MGKQIFDRIKKTMAVLLLVLFVVSVTAAVASATQKDYDTRFKAGFAQCNSGKAPLKVQFTDKSTNSPTVWKWNFGDKATSKGLILT